VNVTVTAISLERSDVILVHDYLLVMRGAERTFETITHCFPGAPIATLLYDPVNTEGRFENRRVRTSLLQPLAADQERFRRYLPLLPMAAGNLPVKDARMVISSSSAFAHGVHPAPDAVHISYCHSPFRYIWHERHRLETMFPAAARPASRGMIERLRQWDVRAARRVTGFIANSQLTRQRIADCYGRESLVVHPPVEVERFSAAPDPRDYLLVVGEVTAHKKVEIALAAAERVGMPIKVVGAGPDLTRLRRRFVDADFLGRVDDRRLTQLYAQCRALVVPAVEEFGITMVEAHAAGRPVVAASRGGAREIVEDGLTGVLVDPGSVESLADALQATDFDAFDPGVMRASAQRFSTLEFRKRFPAAVAITITRAADRDEVPVPIMPRARTPRPYPALPAAVAVASRQEGSLARSRNGS
jgi:glycosyltransferase involved in cell wall biosynthesis